MRECNDSPAYNLLRRKSRQLLIPVIQLFLIHQQTIIQLIYPRHCYKLAQSLTQLHWKIYISSVPCSSDWFSNTLPVLFLNVQLILAETITHPTHLMPWTFISSHIDSCLHPAKCGSLTASRNHSGQWRRRRKKKKVRYQYHVTTHVTWYYISRPGPLPVPKKEGCSNSSSNSTWTPCVPSGFSFAHFHHFFSDSFVLRFKML